MARFNFFILLVIEPFNGNIIYYTYLGNANALLTSFVFLSTRLHEGTLWLTSPSPYVHFGIVRFELPKTRRAAPIFFLILYEEQGKIPGKYVKERPDATYTLTTNHRFMSFYSYLFWSWPGVLGCLMCNRSMTE